MGKPKDFTASTVAHLVPAAHHDARWRSELERLLDAKTPLPQIAKLMGMDRQDVINAMALLGRAGIDRNGDFCSPRPGGAAVNVQTKPASKEECMCCKSVFLSSGAGHRLCNQCRRLSI